MVAHNTGGVTNDWIQLHQSLHELLPEFARDRLFFHQGRILVDVIHRGRTAITFAYSDCQMNYSPNDFTMKMRGSTHNFPNGLEEITIGPVSPVATDPVWFKLYYLGPARIIEEMA